MKVGVPRETAPGERRVALIPDMVSRLVRGGYEVLVERDAGNEASFTDAAYVKAGASVVPDAAALHATADVVLKVQKPTLQEAELLREGTVLISFLPPHLSLDLIRRLADRKVTTFSMDLVPRITRAQEMDALSSMSTLAGYKAVLLGAMTAGRLLPMIVSAAGTLTAARTFIIGVGVAGLQAIATARRLGAVVQAFDIRPATKEQVQSLGAQFVEMDLATESTEDSGGYARELSADAQDRALEAIRKTLKSADLVITTALIPGKPAPRLITAGMIPTMKRGAVIVDLAAEAGGNCELTRPGEEVHQDGVTILGPLNLPASMPIHASQMYGRNVSAVLKHITKEDAVRLDLEDVIVQSMCLTHDGLLRHEATRKLLEGDGKGAGEGRSAAGGAKESESGGQGEAPSAPAP